MQERPHILVVEDDEMIVEPLVYGLEREGFRVSVVMDGDEAIRAARDLDADIILLDVMLPKRSGFEVVKILREEGITTPVIMLTARGQEMDKVMGLEMGADDYVVKPFSMREITARIRAALRRQAMLTATSGTEEQDVLRIGDLVLDRRRTEVRKQGRPLTLSPREFELLSTLMSRAGETISRQELLDRVWGTDWIGDPRTLDVHIHWLREKIEDDPRHPRYIITVRGIGYRFAEESDLQGGKP